jgi:NADH-quinone oxidoreductase subunit J
VLDAITLFLLAAAALWTVMTRSLLRSAMGLALTSIVLTILMFRLNAPLAAMFELSVCVGLISVLFVSMISLTHPSSQEDAILRMRERLARFWFLPLIIIVVAAVLIFMNIKLAVRLPAPEMLKDVRAVLWHVRQVDVLGQMLILLIGVFGVILLFKERDQK